MNNSAPAPSATIHCSDYQSLKAKIFHMSRCLFSLALFFF